jgi:DNA-binding NtrC family response regulator
VSELRRGALLLLARSEPLRRRYRARMPAGREVHARAPEPPAAGPPDLAATVLCLQRGDARDGRALPPLPPAPLVLVACALPEPALAHALATLAPAQLLIDPAPAAALAWAIGRAEAATPASARDQHRPARALLGVSAAIRDVLEQIAQVARARAPVLILGETGTGKELVARAIHAQSGRSEKAFVAINCGALPEALLEAELFGFQRGAFTGADHDHPGLLAQADGGTLFLDEIGDMPPALQVKLLRALETGEVRALGAGEPQRVDLRVVSATHRDLARAIAEGRFRQDLYYRLNTVVLQLPPLRRRRVDIPFLAQHFAEELGAEQARRITLGDDFLDALAQRDFPGNVRELRNTIERAIALAEPGRPLSLLDLPADGGGPPPLFAMGTLRDRIMQLELQSIRVELERCDGNRSRTAAALGLTRYGLRKKMRRLGLE